MDAKILALADRDTDYLEKFNNYIRTNYTGIYECHCFTDKECLMEYGLEHEITVLMVDGTLYSEDLKRIRTDRIFILDEESGGDEGDGIKRINRYRNADSIIKEVLKETSGAGEEKMQILSETPGKLFTIFSPISRSLKTTLAVAMSQLLSDKGKTLYINTEGFSGFNQIFMSKYDTDLSDLIFFLKSGCADFPYKLLGAVVSSRGYDYIPPAMMPADIYAVEGNVWDELFDQAGRCGYEYIVLDMGNFLNCMFEILKRSERVFMPVRTDSISRSKLTQFEALLHISGNEELIGTVEKLNLPFFENIPSISSDLRLSEPAKFIAERL